MNFAEKRHNIFTLLFGIVLLLSLAILFHQKPVSASYVENIGANLEATRKGGDYEKEVVDPKIVAMKLISNGTAFIGMAFLFYLVYGGILVIIARGEEQQITEAKKIITRSTIGIVLMFGAYGITQTILRIVDQNAPLPPEGIQVNPRRGDIQRGGSDWENESDWNTEDWSINWD